MGPSLHHDKHEYFARLVLKNVNEGENIALEPGMSLKFEGYGDRKFFFYAVRKLADSIHWYICVEDEESVLYYMPRTKLCEVTKETPPFEQVRRQQKWWSEIQASSIQKENPAPKSKIQLRLPEDSSKRDLSNEIQDALISFRTILNQLPVTICQEVERNIERILLQEIEKVLDKVTERIIHKIQEHDEERWMRLLEKALDKIGK